MMRSLRAACVGILWLGLFAGDPALAVKRRAFVTSTTGTGDLKDWIGGSGTDPLVWADQHCQVRANVGGLPNAIGYRAWLSTTATDAYCHLRGQTGKRATGCVGTPVAAGPWYLANGITPWTGTLAELTDTTDPRIFRAVTFDENGDEVSTYQLGLYWTGTLADGTLGGNCSGWTNGTDAATAAVGSAFGSVDSWTEHQGSFCDENRRLLCLETGASEEPGLPNSPGSLVFVTSVTGWGRFDTWPDADGLNGYPGADRICRNRAAAGRLPAPESFVAWVSDSSRDAAEAVTSNGPFRRIDGIVISSNESQLLDGGIDAAIHQNEFGVNAPGSLKVWTGTDPDGTYDEVFAENCFQWSLTSGDGDWGWASLQRREEWTDFDWGTENQHEPCSLQRSLYCFSNRVTLFWDGFDYTGDTGRWSDVQN
jgi:hypothetical protein